MSAPRSSTRTPARWVRPALGRERVDRKEAFGHRDPHHEDFKARFRQVEHRLDRLGQPQRRALSPARNSDEGTRRPLQGGRVQGRARGGPTRHYIGQMGDGQITAAVRDPGCGVPRCVTGLATTTVAGWAADIVPVDNFPAHCADRAGERLCAIGPPGPAEGRAERQRLRSADHQNARHFCWRLGWGIDPVPGAQGTFSASTITAFKLGVFCAFSDELARRTAPEIEATLRQALWKIPASFSIRSS